MSAMHTVLTTSDVPPYLLYTGNHYLDPNRFYMFSHWLKWLFTYMFGFDNCDFAYIFHEFSDSFYNLNKYRER